MPKVEFVYDKSCPNVEAARENLLRAFARAGIAPKWTEWERSSSEAPAYVRDLGSPTILVDGKDYCPAEQKAAGNSCRVYADSQGNLSGVPSIEAIAASLRGAASAYGQKASGPPPNRWVSTVAVLPGIGVALLPKLGCPACWPAYAGILSALGLGFLLESQYLMTFTAVFLVISLAALAFRARARRGYGPLALGALAAGAIMIGKFVFESEHAMYAGITLLVAASLWNSWPKRSATEGSCPACVPADPAK